MGRFPCTSGVLQVAVLVMVCVLVCVCVCVFWWGSPACGMALRVSRKDYFVACQLGMVLRTSWNVDLKILLRSGLSDLLVL